MDGVASDRAVDAVVRMRNISKTFPGVIALDEVALDLYPGEVHMLLGENGAGKSTLVKILAGALLQDPGGEIEVCGKVVEIRTPLRSRELGISVIHQELNLVPSLNAVDNMMLGRERRGSFGQLLHAEMEQRVREALERLDVSLDLRRPVEQLSVAEQQIIEIASAILDECRVLILDEPTSALADQEVEKLGEVLERLKHAGVAILYISHRFEEIFRFGDRSTVLRDGHLISTGLLAESSRDELIRHMVGREIADTFPRRDHLPGDVLLKVEGLSSPTGIRDIDLTIRRGEIVALAGLMGSGRTEVARAIFGADMQASGKVTMAGRMLRRGDVGVAIASGLALAPEDRKAQGLVLGLDIGTNITMARLADLTGDLGMIRGVEEARQINRLIDRLDIKATSQRQLAMTLSGGNQQKVVLAKWLHADARLFIFDEPTRGIDVGAKQEVYRLMNELVARGVGILMISSELPEVLGMSDRIVVMCQGTIAGELDRTEATPERLLHLATIHDVVGHASASSQENGAACT